MPNRYCLRCNESIDHMAARAKYCSRSCKSQASSKRCHDRASGKDVPFIEYGTPRKPCDECGQQVKVAGRMFCSRTCQTIARRKSAGITVSRSTEIAIFVPAKKVRHWPSKNREASSRYFIHGTCKECGTVFTAAAYTGGKTPTFCNPHCSRKHFRRTDKYRRRELIKSQPSEAIYRMSILERDSFTCKLCNEPLDMDAHPNDNRAPSLDHILPLAKGGSHQTHNLQAAHRQCNAIKSDRTKIAA